MTNLLRMAEIGMATRLEGLAMTEWSKQLAWHHLEAKVRSCWLRMCFLVGACWFWRLGCFVDICGWPIIDSFIVNSQSFWMVSLFLAVIYMSNHQYAARLSSLCLYLFSRHPNGCLRGAISSWRSSKVFLKIAQHMDKIEVKSCKCDIFDLITLLLMAFVVIVLVNHTDERVCIF